MELHWIIFCLHSYSGPSWSLELLLHFTEPRAHCVCADTRAVPSDCLDVSLQQDSNLCFPLTDRGRYFIQGLSPSQTRVCTLLHFLKIQFSSAKKGLPQSRCRWMEKPSPGLPTFLFCWKLADPSPHSL